MPPQRPVPGTVAAAVLSVVATLALVVALPTRAVGTPEGPRTQGTIPISSADTLITEPAAGMGPLSTVHGLGHTFGGPPCTSSPIPGRIHPGRRRRARSTRPGRARPVPGTSRRNGAAFTYLSAHGVAVRWAPAIDNTFHIKSICVDGARCAIMTLNLTSRYYPTTRDFAVMDADRADVTAVEQTFAGDYQGHPGTPKSGGDLVWSPGSTAPLAALVGGADRTVLVYNEELSDPTMVDALAGAARHESRRGGDDLRGLVGPQLRRADQRREPGSTSSTASIRCTSTPR